MSAMSNYLETEIIKYWFQNDGAVAPKPTNLYVGLFTASPSDAGGGTEVSAGGGYARVTVVCNSTNWAGPTAGDGTVKNGNAITFGTPTVNWNTITSVGVFDAASGGNLLWWGALDVPKTVNNGDAAPSFAANQLTIQVDN